MAEIKITPETALGYIDGVLDKYEGTRTDHRVLEASMSLLKKVVVEWQMQKQVIEAGNAVPDDGKTAAPLKMAARKA